MLDLGTVWKRGVSLPFMISTTDNIRLNERTYIFVLFHPLQTPSPLFVRRTRDILKSVRKLCFTLENHREHICVSGCTITSGWCSIACGSYMLDVFLLDMTLAQQVRLHNFLSCSYTRKSQQSEHLALVFTPSLLHKHGQSHKKGSRRTTCALVLSIRSNFPLFSKPFSGHAELRTSDQRPINQSMEI
jgi:hypothetical protein